MYYVIFGLLGAALLGADQWVKAWVVGHLQMGETTSLFPGFLELMRVHNYGAAWSSFAGQKWLLLCIMRYRYEEESQRVPKFDRRGDTIEFISCVHPKFAS